MAVVFDPPWDPTTQPPKEVQKLIAPSHIHVALTKARFFQHKQQHRNTKKFMGTCSKHPGTFIAGPWK